MFSVAAVLLMAGSMVFLVIALALSIRLNILRGKQVREEVERRLQPLRLSKGVAALGIPLGKYIHAQPLLDVERQMHACSGCDDTQACDQALAEGAFEAFTQCRNHATMMGLRART